jgi:Na+-transporting methylmalonyl-CoA/oxaloacetate decarboxylase gamma subunit
MLLSIQIPEQISQGIVIAITGYVIVFFALLMLYYIFRLLSKALTINTKRKLAKSGKLQNIPEGEDVHISGETAAAIAMAIYLNYELHDKESDVLTIKKISKAYSPWNSKIYGMRNFKR